MEGDPTATSSAAGPQQGGEHERPDEREVDDEEKAKTTLPVTGKHPDDMWEEDVSVAKDISVEDFMQTPLADKFYGYWMRGTVTDRLIGQRFGYGVLGRFYSKRLWDDGCFHNVTSEGEPSLGHGSAAQAEDSFPATQVEAEVSDVPAADEGAEADEACDLAASSTLSTEGSAAVPRSSTEAGSAETAGILTGSRQTSLAHWLL